MPCFETPTLPASLTNEEMLEFILDNRLRDWQGVLDWTEAKEIANASATGWRLTTLPLSKLTQAVLKPRRRRNSLPPIVLEIEPGNYEVNDGRHRCAEANYLKLGTISVYLGTVEDMNEGGSSVARRTQPTATAALTCGIQGRRELWRPDPAVEMAGFVSSSPLRAEDQNGWFCGRVRR